MRAMMRTTIVLLSLLSLLSPAAALADSDPAGPARRGSASASHAVRSAPVDGPPAAVALPAGPTGLRLVEPARIGTERVPAKLRLVDGAGFRLRLALADAAPGAPTGLPPVEPADPAIHPAFDGSATAVGAGAERARGPDPLWASVGTVLAAPVHLVTAVGILAWALPSGAEDFDSDGWDGTRMELAIPLFAVLPPLASGLTVWAIGNEPDAPSSLPWVLASGIAGHLGGIALAIAIGSPVLGFLSVTVIPPAAELLALALTATPPPAPAWAPAQPPEGPRVQALPAGLALAF